MTMPVQKPHRSEQVVQTDPRLIAAVEKRFGPLVLDLAASEENAQAELYFDEEMNSFKQNWRTAPNGNRWLNPPFGMIAKFAAKCVESATRFAPVIFHVPSSTGANWFADYVWPWADIYFLKGRVTYVGHTSPYPKDTIVAIFNGDAGRHREIWDWRLTSRKA